MEKLKRLQQWFTSSIEAERSWRERARLWHRYFHGDQLEDKVIQQLKERGQAPICFNLIAPIVNLVAGQEVQNRTDIEFLGVEDSDDELAKVLTTLYRQIGEANYYNYEMSEAFRDGMVGGRGAIKIHWEDGSLQQEYIDWREIYVDYASKRKDFSDAQFVIHRKWVDLEDAIEAYPDMEEELRKLVTLTAEEDLEDDMYASRSGRKQKDYFDEDVHEEGNQWADPTRNRVRLVECWWREEGKVKWAVFAGDHFMVEPRNSPYKHKQFPFVLTFCNRDFERQAYGIVKNIVDPQDVINKMLSKSMHILATKQVLAEEGAINDKTLFQNEISKPDSMIVDLQPGAISQNKIRIDDNRSDAQLAFQHMDAAISVMQRISGVNPELQGQSSNARSGTAIEIRRQQGNTILAEVYDSYSKTKKKVAELSLSLMAQYMTDEKVVRYIAPNGEKASTKLNTEEKYVDGEGSILTAKVNDISEIYEFDVVVRESVDQPNSQAHELTQLTEILKSVPQVITPQILAEVMRSTNISNKEALAEAFMQSQGTPEGAPQ